MYNSYQKMHYEAKFGKQPQVAAKKEYALYENGTQGNPAPYPLLQYQKQQRIAAGVPAYLLKIKLVKT